jgi:hypothetical protein
MPSSGILRRVALVRTDVSEECRASIVYFRSVLRLPVTANFVPSSSIFFTLVTEALPSIGRQVLTRDSRRNIPEDGILHRHRRENLKPYKVRGS